MNGTFKIFIDNLEKALTDPLPGQSVQYEMAPMGRDLRFVEVYGNPPRESAVSVFLFPENNNIKLLFMKRVKDKTVHSGQLSFPGGGREPEDENLETTALRELKEEMGFPVENVKIIGQLTPVYISVSNFHVYPFVVYSCEPPVLKPNEEVEKVLKVNINELLTAEAKTTRCVTTKYLKNFEVPCFIIEKEVLWGATAMITNELLEIIKKIYQLN